MQILHDYFLVELDRLFETQETKSGLLPLNEEWVQPNQEDRNIYKRIYGTVVSVPRGFTSLKIDPIDPGHPNHRLFIGHDIIQHNVNEGYKWSNDNYHPGTVDNYEFVTIEDVARLVNVNVGDRIYAHPNVFEGENAMWKKDGKYTFRVRVDEIICSVVNGVIRAQGLHTILDPVWEKDSDIISKGGLFIKPQAEKKPNQGILLYGREGLPVGELVFFMQDADWTLGIEGKEVYVIKEDELLCSASL